MKILHMSFPQVGIKPKTSAITSVSGILKNKSYEPVLWIQQNDDQRSTTTASDEDGSITPRSVRFVEKSNDNEEDVIEKVEPQPPQAPECDQSIQREFPTSTSHRYLI